MVYSQGQCLLTKRFIFIMQHVNKVCAEHIKFDQYFIVSLFSTSEANHEYLITMVIYT